MKIKHLLVFLILFSGFVYSNQSFGLKPGINLSRTEYRLIPDRKIIATFGGEICYDIDLLNNKHFGIGIGYSGQGLSFNTIWTDSLGASLVPYKTTLKFHYINIPIKIGYRMNNVIWSIGIDPSLFLTGTARRPDISNTGTFNGYKTDTFNEGINRFDLGVLIECKMMIKISERILLNPAITYRHGLINAFKDNTFYARHRGLTLSICLGYQLGN